VQFLKSKEALSKAGIAQTTAWRMEQAGLFPRKIRVAPKAVRYLDREIEQWIAARVRGVSDNELRELVEKMHQERDLETGKAGR
jgi:prophage regulatory protein